MHWHILFEDNHLIAVFKPAGMLTQPDPGGDPDLFSLVREDLAIRHQKKGEAFMVSCIESTDLFRDWCFLPRHPRRLKG